MSFISSVACWICSVFCLYWDRTEGSLPLQWVMPLTHSSGLVRGNRFGTLGLCIGYCVFPPFSLVISVTIRLWWMWTLKVAFPTTPPHPIPYLSFASPAAYWLSVRFRNQEIRMPTAKPVFPGSNWYLPMPISYGSRLLALKPSSFTWSQGPVNLPSAMSAINLL